MDRIDFFKRESKKLLKDWKTQTKGPVSYIYASKFYDIDDLFSYYGFSDKDRQDIKLARAQQFIARMAGFKKWTELIAASEKELIYAEMLLRNIKNSNDIYGWESFKALYEIDSLGINGKIELAQKYFHKDENASSNHFEMLKRSKLLYGSEKETALKVCMKIYDIRNIYGIKDFESKVKCTHCGMEYKFKDVQVSLTTNDPDAEPFIWCKNHSEDCDGIEDCDGTLFDLIPTGAD